MTAKSQDERYQAQADMLRALGNPARLRLLNLLVRCPACVYELVALTGYRQPYVSQQLAVLRRAGLVLAEQNGPRVRYNLACPELPVLLVGQLT